ncbi:MAG: V-type ATP synthase subunit A [Candidatus Micrarchaeaceae archaeon]
MVCLGAIKRIAGPLVVADGMRDGRMHDVVRVGTEGLIGEIIQLESDSATIQVYEDTGGMRPGEPVESEGVPLSVELGPGLLKGIFDGVQRPLTTIEAKSGPFIRKGIKVPQLDRDKRWKFIADKKMNGKQVTEGVVIGYVNETELIKHRIMVPYGVKGKLKGLKEGSFRVTDAIATVETAHGPVKITMMQRRPVRSHSKYVDKIQSDTPLVTGQRILDTFFPVAKGGVAGIPGPFGSGKCVSGDTPVLLSDGSLLDIKTIYQRSVSDAASMHASRHESIVTVNESIPLFSMLKSKVSRSRSNVAYKGMSDSLISIRTRTGREVKVTPVHRLFRICDDGAIRETMAMDLKKGDFISAVRRFDANNPDQRIDMLGMDDLRIMDAEIIGLLRELLMEANERHIPINIPKYVSRNLLRNQPVSPKIKWAREICSAMFRFLPQPGLLKTGATGKAVLLPGCMTPELAEFLGYFASEGHIRAGRTVVFTNTDERILDRYLHLARRIFHIEGKKYYQKGKAPNALIFSSTLVYFLSMLDVGTDAASKKIPYIVISSSNASLASFLKAYYLGGGSYYDGNVEFSTASKALQIALSYSLARFGILHTLSKRAINGADYFRIFVRGIDNLQLLHGILDTGEKREKIERIKEHCESKKTSYTAIDIVPVSSAAIEKLYRNHCSYSSLKNEGIEIRNYIGLGERMSAGTFKKFSRSVESRAGNQLQLSHIFHLAELLDYIYCDEITGIEKIDGPVEVYDVSLPDYGSNFIGGYGGLVLHNTITLHSLAKYSDTSIVVYVGCGERGNEMTEVLKEFPELKDPNSGRPLMERTVLIANTSNMPVAAREASIYTGITIAEYFRDMGYDVALMADSTSRWAEALREVSSRLEEMPGEEGYPAYLSKRLAEFYERAGRVMTLNGDIGSITVVGAVSPPGGDISEPVSQGTLRVVKTYWALDAALANSRHFPAINWLQSYSLYTNALVDWYSKNVGDDFNTMRSDSMKLLQREAELKEIVQLVGADALPDSERIILEIGRMIREDFLRQNAFDDIDAFSDLNKQRRMLGTILHFKAMADAALAGGASADMIMGAKSRAHIARMREVKDSDIDKESESIKKAIDTEMEQFKSQ